MRNRTRIAAAVGALVVVAGGGTALWAARSGKDQQRTASPGATATATPTAAGQGEAAGQPGSGEPTVGRPASGAPAAGAPSAGPARPAKIPAAKASTAQVEEAFVASSAARLCAIQSQAFQTTNDLEERAAQASKVDLSQVQVKAMTKRLATDQAFAKRVAARFRSTCKPPAK